MRQTELKISVTSGNITAIIFIVGLATTKAQITHIFKMKVHFEET